MKTDHQKIIPQILIVLAFLFFIGQVNAQSFYLKDYLLGNSYDSDNSLWRWKAAKNCPYNYSVKVDRVDFLGGELELRVSPEIQPDCQSNYQISWKFSQDIRTVQCGERIFVELSNHPIKKENCEGFKWQGDHNPSIVRIRTGTRVGESALVDKEKEKDPQWARRNYVFSHYPSHIVHGESVTDLGKYAHEQYARLTLDVCSVKELAESANGGSFTLRIGNKGISFDVVYLFSKYKPQTEPVVKTLAEPIIQHNLNNTEGISWMQINVPGILWNFKGKQVKLVIRFTDVNGKFLPGIPFDRRYVDENGYATTILDKILVNSNDFDLESYTLYMPYYALNLPNTGGLVKYNLTAFALVYSDGKLITQSKVAPFSINW